MSGISKNQKGFTIVELLIVIVIIGILAAITIVAYNGIQARARDTARKSDLASVAKALHLYNVDNGTFAGLGSGCGASGNGVGWLSGDYDGAGPLLSVNQCLVNGKYLNKPMTDPTGGTACAGGSTQAATCFAYMVHTCGLGTYIYSHIETKSQTATDLDGTCAPSWDTDYGMNYVVKVK